MNEQETSIYASLTTKDDRCACAFANKICAESQKTNQWYAYFDLFASLLCFPKSLVRNRAITILAANAQWDNDNRFETILPNFLSHITDEKPITARQCIKALVQIGNAKPQYVQTIVDALQTADFSKYNDSMQPLIEKDRIETIQALRLV